MAEVSIKSHLNLINLDPPLNLTELNDTDQWKSCETGVQAAGLQACLMLFNDIHTSFIFEETYWIKILHYMSFAASTITGFLILS